MGLRNRYYLFQDDGALKRVPHRICDRLPVGEDAIPEYAGTRQRVFQILVESRDRRPVRILDALGCYWDFDEEGRIDDGLRKSGGEWIDVAFSPAARHKRKEGKVVDLVPEIKKKDLHDRYHWTLTAEDLNRIAADIWPGMHGPAPDVTSVQGKAPKRPPLSTEAKWALEGIGSQVEIIRHKLATQSEHSLKGLEFEALRHASYEEPDPSRLLAPVGKTARQGGKMRNLTITIGLCLAATTASAQSMNKTNDPKQQSPGATGAMQNAPAGVARDPGEVKAQSGNTKASPGTVGAAPGADTKSQTGK